MQHERPKVCRGCVKLIFFIYHFHYCLHDSTLFVTFCEKFVFDASHQTVQTGSGVNVFKSGFVDVILTLDLYSIFVYGSLCGFADKKQAMDVYVETSNKTFQKTQLAKTHQKACVGAGTAHRKVRLYVWRPVMRCAHRLMPIHRALHVIRSLHLIFDSFGSELAFHFSSRWQQHRCREQLT